MAKPRQIPRFFWRWMRILNRRITLRYAGGSKNRELLLVLITKGRKSGLPHHTPLQYEEVEGAYYVASARGQQADWFRNLQANPQVEVRIDERQFSAMAEPVTDSRRIADFLELRLRRHPRMMRAMLRMEGLPPRFGRQELEEFASEKALVILRLCEENLSYVKDQPLR